MRRIPLVLFTALALLTACADADDTGECLEPGMCWEAEDASCCCPAAGTGIDCMPVLGECTMWMLDSCDVYCATF